MAESKVSKCGTLLWELLFLFTLAVFFLIAREFFVAPIDSQLLTLKKRMEKLSDKKQRLRREYVLLRRRIEAVRYDPFFIEAAARDVLKLVREGEVPLKTNGTPDNSSDARSISPPLNGSDRR